MDIFVMNRQLVCAVQLPREGMSRAYWSVYDLDNKKLSGGYSDGIGGLRHGSYGSIPCAMKNAKAAARRILRKRWK